MFTHEESRRLASYLLEDVDLYKAGILLCFFTGIRLGELCALKWEDIHLEEQMLTISDSHGCGTGTDEAPEGGSGNGSVDAPEGMHGENEGQQMEKLPEKPGDGNAPGVSGKGN